MGFATVYNDCVFVKTFLDSMKYDMRGLIFKNHEIFRTIVKFVFIDVMNNLFSSK